MARRANIAIEPRGDGRWAVQSENGKRADSLHDRKADAIARGRKLAKNGQTELVIKADNGRIADRDSYRLATRRADSKLSGTYTSKKSEEVIKSSARVYDAALKRLAKR